jgi:hypothetical protein
MVDHVDTSRLSRATNGFVLHTDQLKTEVADSVQDAVKVGLIADFADEDSVLVSRLEGEPLERGAQVFGESALDCDAVFHCGMYPSETACVDPHFVHRPG